MARFILSFHPRQTISCTEFISLDWLNVEKRVDYLALCNMYKLSQGTAPSYLRTNVNLVAHTHNTRSSYLSYSIPQVKTQGSKTFNFNAIKLWNNLPTGIKTSQNISGFKTKCKKTLFE